MINSDRIVPVTKVDLLTLYGNIMKLAGTTVTKLDGAQGIMTVTGSGNAGNKLASEPVKSVNFASGVTAGVVYFIPAYDYVGFSVNGTAVVTEGVDVDTDGVDLYTATLSSGDVTIAKVGL